MKWGLTELLTITTNHESMIKIHQDYRMEFKDLLMTEKRLTFTLE